MFKGFSKIFTLLFLLTSIVSAQPTQVFLGSVTGKVTDSIFDSPIQYASVILFKQSDSIQVSGIATDVNGQFQLDNLIPGGYFVEISFLGYEKRQVKNIRINRNNPNVNLGNIKLTQSVIEGEEVEVTAEKPAIEYKIDKKVVNVDKQYTAASGTAVDVLKTVPSVTTDIEGNVQLRGSSNFNLLIDGRPTPLDVSDALEQIPASSIENIEIITNPSVKYSPEGESGIINIVLKRKSTQGESGMLNLNGGNNEKYGGDFLWSMRRGKATYNLNGSYNHQGRIESVDNERITYNSGGDTTLLSNGSEDRFFGGYNLRGEALYQLTESDRLGVNLSLGRRGMEGSSELDYSNITESPPSALYYTSAGADERKGRHYNFGVDFQHKFEEKNREINGFFTYGKRKMDGETSNQLLNSAGGITSGQINTEEGPGRMSEIQVNYIDPLSGNQKIEAGYQMRIFGREEDTGYSAYDTTSSSYIYYPLYSHNITYDHNVHALYAMYSNQSGKLGYQLGLRGEYAHRIVESQDLHEQYELYRRDYFPSAHFSYDFSNTLQFMTSYSRRLNRFRPWYLEPFITWEDAYNVRQGNPDLRPEIIDSYELGLQKLVGMGFVSCDVFHRTTHNYIENVQSIYSEGDNVILTSIENIGSSYATGLETTLNQKMFRFWDMNLTGSAFNYRIIGHLYGESVDDNNFSWTLRFNNSFILGKNTKFQLNASYMGPTVSSQGENKGVLTTDMALRQEFFDKKFAATLQVADIFASQKRDYTKEISGLYIHNIERAKYSTVSLTLSLNINNYKPDKKKKVNGSSDMEEEF